MSDLPDDFHGGTATAAHQVEGEFCRAVPDHHRRLVHDGGWTGEETGDRLARSAEFALSAAIAAGAEVRGCVRWSLLDDFGWMPHSAPASGRLSVDRETSTRAPKPSLARLGDVAGWNALLG